MELMRFFLYCSEQKNEVKEEIINPNLLNLKR